MGDGVEIVLALLAEIGALGQVLADEAVGVLVGAALPGIVRIGEVDLDTAVDRRSLRRRERHPRM